MAPELILPDAPSLSDLKTRPCSLEELQAGIGAEGCVEREGQVEMDTQILGLVLEAAPVQFDGFTALQSVAKPQVEVAGQLDLAAHRIGLHTEYAVDRTRLFPVQEEVELRLVRCELHIRSLALGNERQFAQASFHTGHKRFVVHVAGPHADVRL